MQKNNNRFNRIDEELKKEISHIISYELKNPDLKYAKVSISILNGKNKKETLAALKKSSGFIRTEVAKKVNLRLTPELIFELDDSMEYGAKIDTILNEIMKDVKPEEKNEEE